MNKCVDNFVNNYFKWYEKLGLRYHKPIEKEYKCLEKYDDDDPELLNILIDQDTVTINHFRKIKKYLINVLFIIPIISLLFNMIYLNALLIVGLIYFLLLRKTTKYVLVSRGIMYNIAQDNKETKLKKMYGDNYTTNDDIKQPPEELLTD